MKFGTNLDTKGITVPDASSTLVVALLGNPFILPDLSYLQSTFLPSSQHLRQLPGACFKRLQKPARHYKPMIPEALELRQENLQKFRASLAYIVSKMRETQGKTKAELETRLSR